MSELNIGTIEIENNDVLGMENNITDFIVDTQKGEHFPKGKNWLDSKPNFIYVYYDNGKIWNRNYWCLNKCSAEIKFNDLHKIIYIERLTITFGNIIDYLSVKNNINL